MSNNVVLALSREALSPWGFSGGKEEPGGEAKASPVYTASTDGPPPLPTSFPDLKILFPLHVSSLLATGQIYSLTTCNNAILSSSSPRRHVSEVPMEIGLLEVERSWPDHMSQPVRSQLFRGRPSLLPKGGGCQIFWKQGRSLLESSGVAKGTLGLPRWCYW